MSNLKSADLEKKSRELEDREQVLSARENLLNREKEIATREKVFKNAEVTIDVLNKQIEAKKTILQTHQDHIDEAVNESQSITDRLKIQEETARRAVRIQQDLLTDLKSKETIVSSDLKSKRKELNDLNQSIKETRDYRDEQNRITEETIAQWNSNLVEFRREADAIQDEKDKLSRDVIRMEQEKIISEEDAKVIERKTERLALAYEEKAEGYKISLRNLDIDVQEKHKEYDELVTRLKIREQEIIIREKSVKLKEGNINTRERDLDQRERRLKMNYGIAGIGWEDEV